VQLSLTSLGWKEANTLLSPTSTGSPPTTSHTRLSPAEPNQQLLNLPLLLPKTFYLHHTPHETDQPCMLISRAYTLHCKASHLDGLRECGCSFHGTPATCLVSRAVVHASVNRASRGCLCPVINNADNMGSQAPIGTGYQTCVKTRDSVLGPVPILEKLHGTRGVVCVYVCVFV